MDSTQGVLGLDIGGTFIRAGLVDAGYRLCGFVMESSAAAFSEDGAPVEVLADFVRRYSREKLDGKMPAAVSIGFPSTLNRDKTTLLSTPNLKNLNNCNIVEPLQNLLEVPVFIDRDVNMLMLYDLYDHQLPAKGILIGCYYGTGLGNVVMINGEVLSGKNGVAAELGHAPLYGMERRCGCGNIGCMETMASGLYLEELVRQHYPGEEIRTVFSRHGGDEVMRRYVEILALPVATEVNIFDPDYVILGGGVLQMADFPHDLLVGAIRRQCRKPLPEENLEIRFATPRQERGVIGAGMYGYERLSRAGSNR